MWQNEEDISQYSWPACATWWYRKDILHPRSKLHPLHQQWLSYQVLHKQYIHKYIFIQWLKTITGNGWKKFLAELWFITKSILQYEDSGRSGKKHIQKLIWEIKLWYFLFSKCGRTIFSECLKIPINCDLLSTSRRKCFGLWFSNLNNEHMKWLPTFSRKPENKKTVNKNNIIAILMANQCVKVKTF